MLQTLFNEPTKFSTENLSQKTNQYGEPLCASCGLRIAHINGNAFSPGGIVFKNQRYHSVQELRGDEQEQFVAENASRARAMMGSKPANRAPEIAALKAELASVQASPWESHFPKAFFVGFLQQRLDFLEARSLNTPRLKFDVDYSGHKSTNRTAGR